MALVSKTFSQIITFTRASTATYFDATGTLQSAAIDVPRLDYDPATLAAQGLLIEEARTNLALYSAKLDQFSAPGVWTLTGAGATLTATTDIAAPDGTMTAWTLTSSGASAQIQQAPTVVIGTVYTGSFWIRRRSGTGTINIRVVENVNTPLTGVTSQWQRFNFTATSTSTTGRLGVFLSGLSDEVDIWGAQLEAGAFPTSYIPTTTTALTRSADVASVNTLSPWYNASASTIYFEGTVATVSDSQNPYFWSISDNTKAFSAREQIAYTRNTSSAQTVGLVAAGGATNASVASSNTAVTANTVFKAAASYAANDVKVCVNGLTPATTASATLPTGLNSLKLGAPGWSAAPVANAFYIRRFTYYPRSFAGAELQSLTA